MTRIENTVFCEGCGAEISWSPVIVYAKDGGRHEFCCEPCRDGLECDCGLRMEVVDRTNQ